MGAAPRILVPCPTATDRAEIPPAAERLGLSVAFEGDDASTDPASFDTAAFIRHVRDRHPPGSLAGIFASDDYPAAMVAAVLAAEYGRPGPLLEAVLNCSDKYRSRVIQAATDASAVPAFSMADASAPIGNPSLEFPVFAKPVKGFLSMFADRADSPIELEALFADARLYLDGFLRPFRYFSALAFGAAPWGIPYMLEGLLYGSQVTVEGYVQGGVARIIGITDSIMYPGTRSFARFRLPSALPDRVAERMRSLVLRLIAATGFDHGVFNTELIYDDESDRIGVIEINPRMCPQFADLVEKVHGTNTYDIGLAIAAGREPDFTEGAGPARIAASFVLRRFSDATVRSVPGAAEIEAVQTRFPGARVRVLCRPGHRLSDEQQDRASFRYALVHLGADSQESLLQAFEEAKSLLPFEFEET